MFKALAQLIPGKSDILTVTMAHENATVGTVRVNLIPKFGSLDKEARSVIDKPITLVGTLEELDGPDFLAGIERINTANQSVKDAFDSAEEDRKAAASSKKPQPAAKPVKTTTVYPKKDEKKLGAATPAASSAPKAPSAATEAPSAATEAAPHATASTSPATAASAPAPEPAPEEEVSPLGI